MSGTGLFANRNFLLLWLGQSISYLGSVISQIAVVLWIAEATNSATVMTSMISLAILPHLILGLLAGAACDTFSRRAIIIWGDVLKAVLCLGTALFFVCLPGPSPSLLPAIFVLYVSTEVVNVFFHPARSTIMADLIPIASLPAAIAIGRTTSETVALVGKGAGGFLLQLLGLPFVLFLDGVSFLVSAWAGFLMQAPRVAPRPTVEWRGLPRKLLADALVGLGYIWGEKDIRIWMLVFCGSTFFRAPVIPLLPFYLKDPRFLGASGEWYGFLMGGFGVGGLIGHWLNVAFAKSRWASLSVLLSPVCIGISYAVLGLVHSVWTALVLLTLTGVFVGLLSNQTWSTMQGRLPAHLRARADTALSILLLGASPPALWLAGIIADATGHRLDLIFLVCGLMSAGIGLWAMSQQAYRAFFTGAAASQRPANTGASAS